MAYSQPTISLKMKMTFNFHLSNNKKSKAHLVNKLIMMLDSQGRLAPIDTKASPISNYRKVRQRR